MAFLEYQLPDMTNVNARLELRVRRLQNFDSPMKRILLDFYDIERQWFESEGSGQWQPLSPKYAAWKQARYPGKPILQRSSVLFHEVAGISPSYLLRGSLLQIFIRHSPFWKAHQEGNSRLPRRLVLAPTIKARATQWHRWVTDWVAGRGNSNV